MELENSIWLIGLIALIAGTMIGALAYRLLAPTLKQADKVKSELDDARKELDQYKAGVTQHFDKTAELVNDLAQNYVKVYQHLADGAQTLGASKSFKDLMEQHQGKAAITVDDPSKNPEVAENDLAVEGVDEDEEVLATPVDYAAPSSEFKPDGVSPETLENETVEKDAPEPPEGVETKDIDGKNKIENNERN